MQNSRRGGTSAKYCKLALWVEEVRSLWLDSQGCPCPHGCDTPVCCNISCRVFKLKCNFCLVGNTCRCVTAVCVSSFVFLLLQSFFQVTTAMLQPESNCKTCLPACRSVCMSVFLPPCLPVWLTDWVSVWLCFSVFLSFCLAVCTCDLRLSVGLSASLWPIYLWYVCRYILAESSRSARLSEVRTASHFHHVYQWNFIWTKLDK